MNSIKVFSPATVSNVCCGFDVLGFSIEGLGDEIIIHKSDLNGVRIKKINGYNVPVEAKENTATVAAHALLDYLNINHGIELEIKTSDSRGVLPKKVDLNTASNQLASMGGFVHSLHTADFDLMRIILKDYLVEKYRSEYVPLFNEIKKTAASFNAICCSISGSGPSVFSLIDNYEEAKKIRSACDNLYIKNNIKFNS